jgi:ABC-type proline/glycine betaine transport system ATPase subunit
MVILQLGEPQKHIRKAKEGYVWKFITNIAQIYHMENL